TAAGIPTWSPTVVLICRSTAYVWQSGRDAQFSADCGPQITGGLPKEWTPSGIQRWKRTSRPSSSHSGRYQRLEPRTPLSSLLSST
ncbi:hypothetical protein KCU62_g6558, partial [Aureobasidium sp. EXF-3399]